MFPAWGPETQLPRSLALRTLVPAVPAQSCSSFFTWTRPRGSAGAGPSRTALWGLSKRCPDRAAARGAGGPWAWGAGLPARPHGSCGSRRRGKQGLDLRVLPWPLRFQLLIHLPCSLAEGTGQRSEQRARS